MPICDWEGFHKPSNAGEEVILPHMNFPLRRIGAVDVGWGLLLEVCVLFVNEGFIVVRHLVILCCEVGINQPVWPQDLLLRPAFDGDGFDKNSIVNIEDDYVLVASVGSDGEPAQMVTEQHARDLDNGHENEVRMCVEGFLGERFHSVNRFAIRWEWWWDSCWGGDFCGLFTLMRLVHVAFFSFIFELDVLLN